MRDVLKRLVGVALAASAMPALAMAQNVPAALTSDPAQDAAHPAGMIPFALPTHGVKINAALYTAAGAGLHSVVVLFHGFPGSEQNLDIARAIQRAGWDVLTLHYRGSWGSPGDYSFTHCLQDGEAALDWLRDPAVRVKYGIDPDRIVVAGHSQGGHVAGWLAGHDIHLIGAILISPGRSFGSLPDGIPRAEVIGRMEANLQNAEGMRTIGATTPEALADELIRYNRDWDLARYASVLAKHPLLVTTSDDGGAQVNQRVADAVKAQPGSDVTLVHFSTDHGYNDHRVALTSTIVGWLSGVSARAQGR